MHTESTSFAGALTSFALAAAAAAQAPQLAWQLERTPPSRNLFAMARHEGIDATVLFGGEVNAELNDTWLWRGGWQRVESPQAPSRRGGAGMVYDSSRQRLVLFGGRANQATFGDTWVFDGANWTQLFPAQSPPSRWAHTIGYDPLRDRVVVKSGLADPLGSALADLWEFNGVTWQLRAQSGADPGSGTVGGTFVFDAPRQQLLLVGSAVTAWDGSTWSARSTSGLPAGTMGAAAYDPVGQRVLLFAAASQTPGVQVVYGYQGLDWSPVATTAVPSDRGVALAYDPVRAEAVGLRTALGSTSDDRSHTFVWHGVGQSGTGWQQVVSGLPPGRRSPAMGYDSVRRRTVIYGGGEGIFPADDLYEGADRTWWPRTPGGGSTVLDGAFAYGPGSAGLLLVGNTSSFTVVANWNGTAFTYPPGGNTLPVRRGFGIAYDVVRQRLLVFGGETSTGLTNQLWSWNGTTWTNLTAAGPGPRRNPAMCYNGLSDRVLMFGGTDSVGANFFGDTWEHDGVAWQLRTPATSPGPRAGSVLVHASHLQRCVLVGGFDAQDRRDTWMWDGSEWSLLSGIGAPDTGTGIAGVYDPDRREVIVFGGGSVLGNNPHRNRGELWRLVDPSLATWTRNGFGCDAGGLGPLRLEALDPPALGTTCRFELLNTPAAFVAFPMAWIGFDNQQWGGSPLPQSLAVIGAPNCFVWADVHVSIPLLPLGARAIGGFVLPAVPAALGLPLQLQGAVWNFATSAVATADLLTGIVGPK